MHFSNCCCFSISRRSLLMAAIGAMVTRRASAQSLLSLDAKIACSFYPNDKIATDLYSFESTDEARQVVTRITNAVGLEPNFKVLQANVPNAAAVIKEQQRLILYSLVFMEQITKATSTEWSAWTILAHEIGHHLNGHTLLEGGSRPQLELQADRFAGHAVRLMGGSLEQALAAYQSMSNEGTGTHPPKSARLEAVSSGWTLKTALGAAPSGSEHVLREVIAIVGSGRLPLEKMTPALSAAASSGTQRDWENLRLAGVIQEIKLEGQHSGADGNAYSLFGLSSDRGKLSCVIGLTKEGLLSSFYVN